MISKDPVKVQAGRIGAYAQHSRHDTSATTAAARQKFLSPDFWAAKVDPDRALSAAERVRRAEAARREHYARMAMASAQARRRREGGAA